VSQAAPPPPPASRPAAASDTKSGTAADTAAGNAAPAARLPPPTLRLVAERHLDAGFRLAAPVAPAYPETARRLGRPGRVQVELEVAPDGTVTGLDVRDEVPGWGFGAAARAAFARARFTPPTVNGEPVRVRWRKTLRFVP
jgi:protein TonB